MTPEKQTQLGEAAVRAWGAAYEHIKQMARRPLSVEFVHGHVPYLAGVMRFRKGKKTKTFVQVITRTGRPIIGTDLWQEVLHK